MTDELKIVLKSKGFYTLYCYVEYISSGEPTAKFVVATPETDNPKSGQIVKSWMSGHYFFNLEDAEEYLDKIA